MKHSTFWSILTKLRTFPALFCDHRLIATHVEQQNKKKWRNEKKPIPENEQPRPNPKKVSGTSVPSKYLQEGAETLKQTQFPKKTYKSYRESLKVFVKYLSVHFMLSVSSQAKKQHVLSGGTWTDNELHSAPSRWHFFLPAKNWREWFLLRSEILAFRMSERGKKVIPYKNRCWVELSKATAATKKIEFRSEAQTKETQQKIEETKREKNLMRKKTKCSSERRLCFQFWAATGSVSGWYDQNGLVQQGTRLSKFCIG